VSGFLYTAVAFVAAIGVLVVVHEFGHFWVARRLGVKVLRFSVGFGRPLWARTFGRDRTEFVLAAIPLGGYVKMLDENEAKVAKKDLPRAFNRQPVWKRAAIVLAGPLFNFLFAILAFWLLFSVGTQGIRPVVGKVVDDSIAAQAGFHPGDVMLSIDGKSVASWDQRRLYLFQRALRKAKVDVEVRNTQGVLEVRHLDLSSLSADQVSTGLLEKGLGLYPAMPDTLPVLEYLDEKGAGAKSGLQKADVITAIDGKPVRLWDDVRGIISAHPERALNFTIERAGQTLSIIVTTGKIERAGKTEGYIGAGPRFPEYPQEMRVSTRLDPLSALAESVQNTWLMSTLTLEMLVKMVKLEVSTKAISGPISIAQAAGNSAHAGWDRFVMFLAVVSISLGVLNLLPVPVLDGGHLAIYLIEAVKGSPLSERSLYWGQQVGITLLFALMALAFYNDFVRILQ
jgi:regulator of sigma E protease